LPSACDWLLYVAIG